MRMNHEAHKGKIVRSQWASKMGFILATGGCKNSCVYGK